MAPCHPGPLQRPEALPPWPNASPLGIAVAALLALGSPISSLAAQTADPFTDRLSGDWGGLRPELLQRGIDLRLLLISDPYGNSRGGLQTGFTGYSMLSGDLLLDTEPSLGIAGVRFSWAFR